MLQITEVQILHTGVFYLATVLISVVTDLLCVKCVIIMLLFLESPLISF